MGSGKTTLGKKLAKKLDKPFFDLDEEIEKMENRSIVQIFSESGEAHFRLLETKVLDNIISQNKSFVLSLGGGTPCKIDNLELLNTSGVSIYLKCNAGILASRLIAAKAKRPLIKDMDFEELKSFISHKLEEREAFYGKSTYTLEKKNIKLEDLLKVL
jgi:shikimate kinase